MGDRSLMQFYFEELLKRISDLEWHGSEMSYWNFDKKTLECLRKEAEKLRKHIEVRNDLNGSVK